ncbi:MAG: arginyltransferase [Rhodospirillales bacterium]|jgi:leucyl-tRNA---protein transferase|nr:arginyltransferase [Rhodospirillales bacterium]MBT4007155.1 arginyltransferase [Rhodospirillales bacterium]MBT5076670.1 arginyltransferase [Rhodospirillales bacterium]MBT5113488.1 arginyltransferase [Rhodospirillales bacterium]MBT5673786.1 arginyltransferase [Rhodospirillales bacterium]
MATHPHPLYGSRSRTCPYLGGREERTVMAELTGDHSQDLYDHAIRAGFRRSHNFIYRPACPGCDACQPVRVDAQNFSPTRSLSRVDRTNADLLAVETQPQASEEQYRLFTQYQTKRHPGGGMDAMSMDEFRLMMESSPLASFAVQFRDPDGILQGVMLADEISDGLSAVYSFFDPDQKKRALGTFMILWLIDACKRRGLPYLYLGYRIPGYAKMAYKARFQPMEVLGPDGWAQLPPDPVIDKKQAV